MFTCPGWKDRLVRAKSEAGIFWVCRRCDGRGVSLPVLRKTVEKRTIYRLWRSAVEGSGVEGRGCPACERPMCEIACGPGESALKLDVCRRCQFVWFDPKEYERLPSAPREPKKKKIEKELPEKAREALAMMQISLIKEKAQAETEYPDEGWKTIPAFFGLPIEFDASPVSRLPWTTWSLLVVTAAISAYSFSDLERFTQQYGLVPQSAWRYSGLTFLTSFFLHGSVVHLLGNLYFLWIFGDNVEDYLGPFCYMQLILLATVAGGFAHVWFDPRPEIPVVGASGGISGLIVFYALQYPRARLGFA